MVKKPLNEFELRNVSPDDFINQAKGLKLVKQRKRQEKSQMHYRNNEKNLLREFNKEGDRLAREGKIPMPKEGVEKPKTKRQKVSGQIQHGFNVAKKWQDETNDKMQTL